MSRRWARTIYTPHGEVLVPMGPEQEPGDGIPHVDGAGGGLEGMLFTFQRVDGTSAGAYIERPLFGRFRELLDDIEDRLDAASQGLEVAE